VSDSQLQQDLGAQGARVPGRGHAHPGPREYVRIGAILGILTAIEVAASYTIAGALLIALLLGLAIIKFAIVVMWFMHLKFDDRRYARFFVMGLSGAAVLYLVVLISFRVFLR
jgi:cytochrome c oxidase subunit IV